MGDDNPQYDNLKVRKDRHVAVVAFNRPAKANALNHAHLADIEAVALSFREDTQTRAVVFTARAGTSLPARTSTAAAPSQPGCSNKGGWPAWASGRRWPSTTWIRSPSPPGTARPSAAAPCWPRRWTSESAPKTASCSIRRSTSG